MLSEVEKKALQHSVPWQNVLRELYKTYSKNEIFNLMERGELAYAVHLMDETLPHGLDALWLYGSDSLEAFLEDYNVWFYRDSLSDVLSKKPEEFLVSESKAGVCPENIDVDHETLILNIGTEAEQLYESARQELKVVGIKNLLHADSKDWYNAILAAYQKLKRNLQFLKKSDIDNPDAYSLGEKPKRRIVGIIIATAMAREGYSYKNKSDLYAHYFSLKR